MTWKIELNAHGIWCRHATNVIDQMLGCVVSMMASSRVRGRTPCQLTKIVKLT